MTKRVEDSYFGYAPTKGVPATFAALFLISGLLHTYQNNVKRKTPRIGFLLPWSAAIFTAGFIVREVTAHNRQYDNLNLFIATSVLIFAAPPVYQGADYFIMGRALYYIPYLSPIHPGRVITTFIGLDTLIEILTGNGASRAFNSSNSPSSRRVGIDLIKATLIMQIVLFFCFVSLIVVFHVRCLRAKVFVPNIRTIIYLMYTSCTLILIRNIFRTIAFFQPYDAYINLSEPLFYILETLPMFANTVLLNVFPPAKYLPQDHKVYLAKDGKTEIKGPGWVDKRPFWVTLLDPFDLRGLIKGTDKKMRFWDEDGITPATNLGGEGKEATGSVV
ncbi:MAG: hypothetical protein Q9160_007212 [Pyrenula sp. 1 TL-2023]